MCEALRDFSTAPPLAPVRPEASGAVGKSVLILRDSLCKAILVKDCELIHGCLPIVCGASPVGGDVAQREPDQLGGRVVAGEVPPCLDDFAQPRIDALDSVGRVNHPSHLGRKGKEWNHIGPCLLYTSPSPRDS